MIINAIVTTSTIITALLIAVIIVHSIVISAISNVITVIVNQLVITCLQRTFMIFKNIKHIKNVTRFGVIHVCLCFLELSPLEIKIKFSYP